MNRHRRRGKPKGLTNRGPGKVVPGALRKKITIADIADATRLSKATISLVLRNSPSIPPATRARVLEASARLGYVYNRGAASLRSDRTNTVGVIINDLTNPYFAEIVAAIQGHLNADGRFVFLCNTGESRETQTAYVAKLREYNVDGIIMCPAEGTDPEWIGRIRSHDIPLVLLSRRIAGVEVDSVGPDNAGGMRLAMEHLIGLGHRRIAMVGISNRTSTGVERRDGYLKTLKTARIAIDRELMIACPPTRDAGMQAVIGLMSRKKPPTAIVCFNDILAFGVMLGLRSLGHVPGKDVSVVGFDDIAEATLWRPALTTVAISRSALAEAAVRLLSRRMSNPSGRPEGVLVAAELKQRATTAAVRAGACARTGRA